MTDAQKTALKQQVRTLLKDQPGYISPDELWAAHDAVIDAFDFDLDNVQPVPAGVEWVTVPTISVTPPVAPEIYWKVEVSAGEALWAGAPVPYAAATFTASLPGEPYQRVDGVYADELGNIGYVPGRTGLVGIDPPIPDGTLPVGNTYWNNQGGGTTPPNATVDETWHTVQDAANVTLDYIIAGKERPNQRITPTTATSITAINLPGGKDMRVKFLSPAGKVLNLGTGTHKDFGGNPITTLPLSSEAECVVLINNAGTHLTWSLTGSEAAGGGSVDTVNSIAPDAGTKNITLLSSHIDNAVNDATWWGTASLKIKGALDYLANKVKLNEAAILLRVKNIKQGTTTYSPDANGLLTLPEVTPYTPPIPYTRTAQTGTTIVFNQSKDQYRALTANLVISDITNPVQGEEIVLEVDGTGNAFTFSIASSSDTTIVLNGTAFKAGKKNYVGIRCVNAAANTYIIHYIS